MSKYSHRPRSKEPTPSTSAVVSSVAEEIERLKLRGDDDEEGRVSPPVGFTGTLAEGEFWQRCPYFKDHKYLRPVVHLTKCRQMYKAMKEAKYEYMDIDICQYNWDHHVHEDELQEHEKNCRDQPVINKYMQNYYARQRAKVLEEAKAEKEKVSSSWMSCVQKP